MAPRIPIQNIYYLLCYAWNQFQEGALVNVEREDSPELADLLARVLINGVHHLQRRGLEQTYQAHEATLVGVRGRVDFANSARRMLLVHGQAHCRFDELTVNTLPNQIIKATLRRLYDTTELATVLKRQLYPLYRDLREVDNIRLTAAAFRRVQLHSNNRFYRFLLNVCELILNTWLPTEQAGGYRFHDFLRDEKRMGALFEAFLRNFYRQHLAANITVSAPHIPWQATSITDSELALLPVMRTDIVLQSASRRLIIDAKYYGETLQTYYDKQSFHSKHLYQLLSYVQNAAATPTTAHIEGMLIYPVVTEALRHHYDLLGHRVSIATVNLAQPWPAIHSELLNLIEG